MSKVSPDQCFTSAGLSFVKFRVNEGFFHNYSKTLDMKTKKLIAL